MQRQQTITEETMERVQKYAKAYRLNPDALIEAAITMVVPTEIGDTATLNELELGERATQLTTRFLTEKSA